MLQLKIDSREPEEVVMSFLDLATELESRGKESFEIVREQLICGDVICGNIVIERKERNDFTSSITDGRLKEQAAKMCLNFEHRFIIIVGSPYNSDIAITPRAIIGAQTSLLIRNGISILYVSDNDGFAWACYSLITKMLDGKRFDLAEHEVKAFEITPENRFIGVLAATGIGWERAKAVANHYKSMPKVLEHIDQLSEIEGVGKKSVEHLKKVLLGTVI